MKNLSYIIIACLCVLVFIPSRCFDRNAPGEIRRDTIETVRVDTFRDTVPVPIYERLIDSIPVKVYVPVPGDTVRDTTVVYLPITQKVYRDSLYTAYVSGYRAKLDSKRCTDERGLLQCGRHRGVNASGWAYKLATGWQEI